MSNTVFLKVNPESSISKQEQKSEGMANKIAFCEDMMSLLYDSSLLLFEASSLGISEQQLRYRIFEEVGNKPTMPYCPKTCE